MVYENLKSLASQVSNQLNAGLSAASSIGGASPLQTDVLAGIQPWTPQPEAFMDKINNITNNINSPEYMKLSQIQQNLNQYGGLYMNASGSWMQNPINGNVTNTNWQTDSKGNNITYQNNFDSNMTFQGGMVYPEQTNTSESSKSDKTSESSKSDKTEDLIESGVSAATGIANAIINKNSNKNTGTGNGLVDGITAFTKIGDAGDFVKGGGAKAFVNSKQGLATAGALNIAAAGVNALANMGVGSYDERPDAQQLNGTQEAIRSGVYSAVSMIPGFGPLISAGLQLNDGLGKMLGTQMSNISKDAAEDAGLKRGFNNVMATIPGLGSVMGLFAKKTNEFDIDRDRLAGVGSAYDMSTFDSAENLAGGRFLGQGKKVNEFIEEQNRLRDTITSISDTQKLRKEGASAAAADLAQQNKNRYSGLTGGQMAIGKKGMKLDLSWARGLLSKFQKGGKLGTPGIESNVIVEGAYHAHKNHLDEVNPELSDMTPKGIPVATEDASGNKTQVAEIEVGELILTKDLTDKLEELYKDGSDDAAIQAGILFANEIIDNTVDNKGGVLDEND